MKPHEKMEPETAYEQTRKDDSIGVAVERDSGEQYPRQGYQWRHFLL